MTRFLSMLFSIFMFFFSWLIPAETPGEKPFDPHIIEINGITYQNGFVPQDMHFNKKYDVDTVKPVYSQFALPKAINYYPFEDNWIIRGESATWDTSAQSVVYCPVDEWEKFHSYYADPNNYNYCFTVQIDFGNNTKYEIPDVDMEMFERIIQFDKDNGYGTNSSNKAETITLPISHDDNVRFYQYSKDGMFYNHTTQFTVYEDHVYYYRYSNMAVGQDEVSVLPEEMENYILSLLEENDLCGYFE